MTHQQEASLRRLAGRGDAKGDDQAEGAPVGRIRTWTASHVGRWTVWSVLPTGLVAFGRERRRRSQRWAPL